jgi:hypothetical protein
VAQMFRSHLCGSGTLDLGTGPCHLPGFIPENASVESAVYSLTPQPVQPPDLDWLVEN